MFALVTLVAGLAVLVVIHTLTPSRRWPAMAAAFISGLFATAWIEHWVTASVRSYDPGTFDANLSAQLTIGFAIAVLLYFAVANYLPDGESSTRGAKPLTPAPRKQSA